MRESRRSPLIGRTGIMSGLVLRIGQCAFAAASVGFMVPSPGFYSNTAFCYLIASMGLQMLWSFFGLAYMDGYALSRKRDLQNPVLFSVLVVGDWVTDMLSLTVVCSSAGVIVFYEKDIKFCKQHDYVDNPCIKFVISVALAFITWVLIAISSHVMFWTLASV
ncbi:hypothetical protein Q3G72_035144 [Acer saccharum]|nr:hypothetical protein Q3G72_035144 [Acer saccharum]